MMIKINSSSLRAHGAAAKAACRVIEGEASAKQAKNLALPVLSEVEHKKKVMAFGTFDHFHAGHESYLSQARRLGDTLIVVVARDQTVHKIKGRLPDQTEKARIAGVEECDLADKVILGESGDKYAVILKNKPDIIALGYDQFAFTFRLEKFLIDNGMNSTVVRLNPYEPDVYKSSLIRNAENRVPNE